MPSATPPRPPFLPPNWSTEIHYLVAPFYANLPPTVTDLIRSKHPPPLHKPNSSVEIRLVSAPTHPACGQRGLYAKKAFKQGELIIWYTGHVHLDPEIDPALGLIREKSDYDLTLAPLLKSLLPPGSIPDEALAKLPYDSLGIAVDASQMGNEARFCNDYRGVPPTTPSITLHPKAKPGKPTPSPKSRPNGFFHSLRTTTLTTQPVLDSNKTTPAERMKADKGELRMGIFACHDIGKGEEILISYGKSFWSSRTNGGDP